MPVICRIESNAFLFKGRSVRLLIGFFLEERGTLMKECTVLPSGRRTAAEPVGARFKTAMLYPNIQPVMPCYNGRTAREKTLVQYNELKTNQF